VPRRGGTDYLKAPAAFVVGSIARGPRAGRDAFNFFVEERTHLFPRAAFEAAGHDLLQIVTGQAARALTRYERLLESHTDAVLFARFPQIPSSRAFGTSPAGSVVEYRERAQARRSSAAKDPSAPRPFPAGLKETCALSPASALPRQHSVGGAAPRGIRAQSP